jgi:hypothetical protein
MAQIKRTKLRLDYYEITAENDDRTLFKDKIEAILADVAEKDREFQIGTSLFNFHAQVHEAEQLIIGSTRDLRYIVPSKGKIGTNQTEQIHLDNNEGISETTYFIYDYGKNKLVISYNYHGPKVVNLVNMINRLYKDKIIPTIEPKPEFIRSSYKPVILGNDIELALSSKHISGIVARTRKPVESREISDEADWPDLMKAYDLPPEVTKELTLRDKGGSLFGVIKRLLPKRESIEYYDKFRVNMINPETEKVDVYDLIQNKLKALVIVSLKDNSREIDGASAIEVMRANLAGMTDKYDW